MYKRRRGSCPSSSLPTSGCLYSTQPPLICLNREFPPHPVRTSSMNVPRHQKFVKHREYFIRLISCNRHLILPHCIQWIRMKKQEKRFLWLPLEPLLRRHRPAATAAVPRLLVLPVVHDLQLEIHYLIMCTLSIVKMRQAISNKFKILGGLFVCTFVFCFWVNYVRHNTENLL